MGILPSLKRVTSLFNRRFISLLCISILGSFIGFAWFKNEFPVPTLSLIIGIETYRQRPECTCVRPKLLSLESSSSSPDENDRANLCNPYATHRGMNQRIVSISLFGPKEAERFALNQTLRYLDLMIKDLNQIYSDGFVLRIHHDDTIDATNVICPVECQHPNVDFCNMTSKLFIPPKIWRFIPAGDPMVDTMMSRDLDSALTRRERDAVDAWLSSNKSFHSMRDHPMHGVPMLGGMWGFRPSLNPAVSKTIHDHIHNKDLVRKYGGRADQTFLSSHVWPMAKASAIVHDSFLCTNGFGFTSEPFPTQRPSANEFECFIGCVRSCCGHGKMPFGECPKECRPKNHPEWNYC